MLKVVTSRPESGSTTPSPPSSADLEKLCADILAGNTPSGNYVLVIGDKRVTVSVQNATPITYTRDELLSLRGSPVIPPEGFPTRQQIDEILGRVRESPPASSKHPLFTAENPMKELVALLNKFTPEKAEKLTEDLMNLLLNKKSEDIITEVTKLIFDKIITDSFKYAGLWARVAKTLQTHPKGTTPRTILQNIGKMCQSSLFVDAPTLSTKNVARFVGEMVCAEVMPFSPIAESVVGLLLDIPDEVLRNPETDFYDASSPIKIHMDCGLEMLRLVGPIISRNVETVLAISSKIKRLGEFDEVPFRLQAALQDILRAIEEGYTEEARSGWTTVSGASTLAQVRADYAREKGITEGEAPVIPGRVDSPIPSSATGGGRESPAEKKKQCRVYARGEECPYGDECHFSHEGPISRKLCNEWKKTGECRFGDRCKYLHKANI